MEIAMAVVALFVAVTFMVVFSVENEMKANFRSVNAQLAAIIKALQDAEKRRISGGKEVP